MSIRIRNLGAPNFAALAARCMWSDVRRLAQFFSHAGGAVSCQNILQYDTRKEHPERSNCDQQESAYVTVRGRPEPGHRGQCAAAHVKHDEIVL